LYPECNTPTEADRQNKPSLIIIYWPCAEMVSFLKLIASCRRDAFALMTKDRGGSLVAEVILVPEPYETATALIGALFVLRVIGD